MALVRIYIAKADRTITTSDGDNPVRIHGGNCSWTDTEEKVFGIKIKNLTASGHIIFTSPACDHPITQKCDDCQSWNIDDVIRGMLGAKYPAGLYEM